jgi:hypothetical protein
VFDSFLFNDSPERPRGDADSFSISQAVINSGNKIFFFKKHNPVIKLVNPTNIIRVSLARSGGTPPEGR